MLIDVEFSEVWEAINDLARLALLTENVGAISQSDPLKDSFADLYETLWMHWGE